MKTVQGTVIELKSKGLNRPTIVTVEYEIDGKKYQIKESLKLSSKIIKWGFLPIGQQLTPKVDCKVGNSVTIVYNENKPEKGHIEGNDGFLNC